MIWSALSLRIVAVAAAFVCGGSLGACEVVSHSSDFHTATPDAGSTTIYVQVDSGPVCPAQQRECVNDGGGTSCVNVTSDPANCGGCGSACDQTKICTNGSCGCPEGSPTYCADGGVPGCTALGADPSNCGLCGMACGPDTVCSNGTCTVVCATGKTTCGSDCVLLESSSTNCGGCGQSCGAGVNCNDFACCASDAGCSCTGGTVQCAGGCTDPLIDSTNCGACGVVCGSSQSCRDGHCACGNTDTAPVCPLGGVCHAGTAIAGPTCTCPKDTVKGDAGLCCGVGYEANGDQCCATVGTPKTTYCCPAGDLYCKGADGGYGCNLGAQCTTL